MKHLFLAALAMSLGVVPAVAQQNLQGEWKVEKNLKMEKSVLKTKKLFSHQFEYEVIETQELPNNCRIEVRKCKNGGLYKALVKPGQKAFEMNPTEKGRVYAQAFQEDFEGWDGETPGWLPDGWTRKVSNDEFLTLEEGRFSWHVGTQINTLPHAVNGDNFAVVYYAHYKDEGGKTVDIPQDEWLITPSFKVGQGDVFSCYLGYSPFFLFDVSGKNVDWGANDFTVRKPSINLHVLIREENGGEWVELGNLYDEWKDASFDELFNDYFSSTFKPYEWDLTGYEGKKVQIAFRYEGVVGNTMEIDAVKVVSGNGAHANYLLPQGTFNWGFSEDFMSVKDNEGRSLILTPAYNNLTWFNLSEGGERYEWNYSDPSVPNVLDNMLQTDDVDLNVNYQYGLFGVPTLTAIAEDNTISEYKYPAIGMQTGGQSLYSDGKGGVKLYGVGNYDLSKDYVSVEGANGSYLFGHSEGTDKAWSDMYGKNVSLKAIGNVFDKPMIPYCVSRVMVHGVGDLYKDSKFKLTVYRMNGPVLTDEVLAEATCTGADAVEVDNHENLYVTLPFYLDNLIVKGPIMMVLTGFNGGGILNFGVLHTRKPSENDVCYGFYFMDMGDKVETYPLSELELSSGTLYSSFLFGMDATYSWVLSDKDKMGVKKSGGLETFQISTYFDNNSWEISSVYPSGKDEGWVHVVKGESSITIKVDAWKGNGVERTCDVVLNSAGAEKVFKIYQNETGASIDEAEENATKVWSENDAFVIVSDQDAVEVINAAGIKMGVYELNGTRTEVPAVEWPNGVYLFKFADGSLLKVMK